MTLALSPPRLGGTPPILMILQFLYPSLLHIQLTVTYSSPITKKNCSIVISTDCSLGKIKANIYLVIARQVFKNDPTYGTRYAAEVNQPKFGQAIANYLI